MEFYMACVGTKGPVGGCFFMLDVSNLLLSLQPRASSEPLAKDMGVPYREPFLYRLTH